MPIPHDHIEVRNVKLDADGKARFIFEDNLFRDITPNVKGSNYYTFTVDASKECNCSGTQLLKHEWDTKGKFPNLIWCHTSKLAEATPTPPNESDYNQPGIYNCLAWCIGENTWFWRQASSSGGSETVTVAEMNAFLSARGKTAGTIAYYGNGTGSTAILSHVAKISGGSGSDCTASSKLGHKVGIAHDLGELADGEYGKFLGYNY